MKNRPTVRKILALVSLIAAVPAACVKKSADVDSDVMWAVSGFSTSAVESALQARIAFRLNLRTNRATIFKDGVAVDQWNIASADVTGEWHHGQPQYTPTGVFNVEDMQMCPAWYPRNPVNPATGTVVSSERERQQVFAQNPQVYGACGARNPLGKYVLWFNGAYGMHGNSAEEILELADPEERRVSGGCVRNPNAKIKSVFHTVLETFEELNSFAGQVDTMESRANNDRWTITKGVSALDMRVVVGNWSADPAIGTRIAQNSRPTPVPVSTPMPEQTATPVVTPTIAPTATPTAAPTAVPTVAPSVVPFVTPPLSATPSTGSAPLFVGGKMSCWISAVDSTSGVAPVYLNLPAAGLENRVSSFYRMGWPVTVFGKIQGSSFFKVSRGYIDEKYLRDCSSIP